MSTRNQPKCTEYPDGHKEWWLHDERHRVDGPAIEYADGYKAWFLHGKRHRVGGPAIEHPDGTKAWWLHGKRYDTELEYHMVVGDAA